MLSTSTCFSSLTEEVLTLEQFFCGNFSSFARFLKWNLCKFMWHFLLQYIVTIKSPSKEETNCRKKIWHSVKHQRRRDEKFNYLRCSFGSFSPSRLFFCCWDYWINFLLFFRFIFAHILRHKIKFPVYIEFSHQLTLAMYVKQIALFMT